MPVHMADARPGDATKSAVAPADSDVSPMSSAHTSAHPQRFSRRTLLLGFIGMNVLFWALLGWFLFR
jgi:hypothetical protein